MAALADRSYSLGQAGAALYPASIGLEEEPQDFSFLDHTSFADLNSLINPSNDMDLAFNPVAYRYPFTQSQTPPASPLWSASLKLTSDSQSTASIDSDSPEALLYSTSTPTLSQSLLYGPQTSNLQIMLSDDCIDSIDSSSETTSAPVSPASVTAAAALSKSPVALRFRHQPYSKRRVGRQIQGGHSQDLHWNYYNGIDAEEEEQDDSNAGEEEQEHEDGAQASRAKRGRVPHCVVERRYRKVLNAEIRRLQMAIPQLAQFQPVEDFGKRRLQPTKATIIASAVQYIKLIELERDALLAGKKSRCSLASPSW